MSPITIVMIVGIVIFVILFIAIIVSFVGHSNALDQAERNLELAFTQTINAFSTFGTTVFSAVTRLVTGIRDLLTGFAGALSRLIVQLLRFFSDSIARIFAQAESLYTSMVSGIDQLALNITTIIGQFEAQIYVAYYTIPTNIAVKLFVIINSAITGGIRKIYCDLTAFIQTVIDAFTSLGAQITSFGGLIPSSSTAIFASPSDVTSSISKMYNAVMADPEANVRTTTNARASSFDLEKASSSSSPIDFQSLVCYQLAPLHKQMGGSDEDYKLLQELGACDRLFQATLAAI